MLRHCPRFQGKWREIRLGHKTNWFSLLISICVIGSGYQIGRWDEIVELFGTLNSLFWHGSKRRRVVPKPQRRL